jgi:hypothetical protein
MLAINVITVDIARMQVTKQNNHNEGTSKCIRFDESANANIPDDQEFDT